MNTAKYFPALIYVHFFLLVMSVLIPFYAPFMPSADGLLGFLWGVLLCAILLWLLERLIYYAHWYENDRRSRDLPQYLLHEMRAQDTHTYARRMLKAFNGSNFVLLACVFLWGLWGLWCSYDPPAPERLGRLDLIILDVFQAADADFERKTYRFFGLYDAALAHILPASMIVMAGWTAQMFGYSHAHAATLRWMAFGLFACFALLVAVLAAPAAYGWPDITLWRGYGWGRHGVLQALGMIGQGDLSALQVRYYETGLIGALLAYMPALVVAARMAGNAFDRGWAGRARALVCAAVLMLLLYADVFCARGAWQFSLNLSGWVTLAFFSLRHRQNAYKVYRLYQ